MSAQNASELSEALETAVEIPAELPTGKLSVKVTAEGKLQDSFLKITNTNTGEELKGQRTYSKSNTNPRIVSLPDGIYDLEVSPIRMKGVESRKITGIEIKEGEVVEKEVDFGFGELSIKVVRNGKLMDSTVYVYKLETEETVAKGRTYNSSGSNPIVLKLDPGVYDISIKAASEPWVPQRSTEEQARRLQESCLRVALSRTVESRYLIMPHQANPQGTAFGGVIMAWIDMIAV